MCNGFFGEGGGGVRKRRTPNHCCNREVTMHSVYTVELHFTVNNTETMSVKKHVFVANFSDSIKIYLNIQICLISRQIFIKDPPPSSIKFQVNPFS